MVPPIALAVETADEPGQRVQPVGGGEGRVRGGTRLWLWAQMSEPAMREPAHTMSISRLPYMSPQPPHDGDGHARGQQRRGQQPLGTGRRAADILRYPRQHRDQQRLIQRDHQPAEGDHRYGGYLAGQPAIRIRLGRSSCRDVPARRFLDHRSLSASCGTAHRDRWHDTACRNGIVPPAPRADKPVPGCPAAISGRGPCARPNGPAHGGGTRRP